MRATSATIATRHGGACATGMSGLFDAVRSSDDLAFDLGCGTGLLRIYQLAEHLGITVPHVRLVVAERYSDRRSDGSL